MRLMTIASGSSGNCIYVGSENTHILIDSGISRKKIADGLALAGLSMKDISAVFVTHEHIDHIKGLGVISRKDSIPIYSTKGTIRGIKECSSLGEMDESLFNEINADADVFVNDLQIHPFKVSHDANEPVAYTVKCKEKKIGIATDLGFYDDYIVDNIKGSQAMLIEANHDVNLLQVGSYPYYLKQRILSNKGHLSNETSGHLIDSLQNLRCIAFFYFDSLLENDVKNIFLGHLSKENNYDKLAYETVRLEIDMSDSEYRADDFDITVANRDIPSKIVEI